MPVHPALGDILSSLDSFNCSIPTLIVSVLTSQLHADHHARSDLIEHLEVILDVLLLSQNSAGVAKQWACRTSAEILSRNLTGLVQKSNGWHFSALHASPDQIRDFQFLDLAKNIQKEAPELWGMLGALLSKSGLAEFGVPLPPRDRDPTRDEDIEMDDEEASYWENTELISDMESRDDGGDVRMGLAEAQDAKKVHRELVLTIKRVVIVSIMMQSMNQQCNALQSIVGIFLHSCNAPEKVIKMLAHMGLSISLSSIHLAIHSLSLKASADIRTLCLSLLAAYAYDNFDIDFKTTLPTVDQPLDTLVHLTSGLYFQLEHGVKLEALKCSAELWQKSRYNDAVSGGPARTVGDLAMLHPDYVDEESGLNRRGRYNAWKFRYDLVHHGPEYFRRFIDDLGEPETLEKIPVTKLKHVPARAMDINQSKVSGNIQAIEDLLAQGGVGDPSDEAQQYDVKDITEYVVLFHGDLGTMERIQSAQERRALEDTAWRRLQFAVFVPGLFHLKMAAADAIWRALINEKGAQDDPNSLKTLAGILRPKETGKIASKPGFRRTHEIIGHAGTVLRLDCWRVEACRRNADLASLHDFASTAPTWDTIRQMSFALAENYVAGTDSVDIYSLRTRASSLRDQQRENTLLMQQYLLLYEELSYAMNGGDIARIETLFPPWIWIFRATGKHKYASGMLRWMTDVHFVYPEGLKLVRRVCSLGSRLTYSGTPCATIAW
ncbi:hypothetical protein FA95DRAFT_1577390 [Auriscalpium vulgare]|uniref:Uncharacterized protein n=1 Tax=Auriscalpium vulgare TaxID=40419 RepID=A0ACB8R786_9AGAM|nr:hypothetical protein FA95DRAFT_1577390 [Auriscalpium vulgare]